MSYIHSKIDTSRLAHGAGSAYILEPDNHDIHPDDEWSKHPALENVDMNNYKIKNLSNPNNSKDAVNKSFLTTNYYDKSTADSNYLKVDGTNKMNANLNMDSNKITNVIDPTSAQEASTKNYVDSNYYDQSTSDNRYVRTDGANAMSSDLDMGTNKITSVVDPTSAQEASTKNYVDSNYYDQSTSDSRYVRTDGANAMSSDLNMGTNKITSVVDPTSAQEASTKNYVDSNYYNQSTSDSRFSRTDGNNSMSDNLNVGDNKVTNVNDPTNNKDAVNLQYLNANSGELEIKEVTDVQSSTLTQNGAISHSKQVTGLANKQYLCRIQLIVWGNFDSGGTVLQFLLTDDGFTDQYDPAKMAQQNDDSNVSRFGLVNGGEIGRENQETSVYNFTILTNTTQQITFNRDVIDNGGLSSDSTVHSKLHVFISPASIL